MHPFLLIPLLTLVLSCVVGSATVARGVPYRPNHVVALAMLCTGLWAVVELGYSLQTDAESALQIARYLGFCYLPLAPLVLELLASLGLLVSERYTRVRTPLWIATLGLAAAHAATPWFIDAVFPTSYGWRYHFGPAFWPGLLATLGGCAACAMHMVRSATPDRFDASRLRWFGLIIWLPIGVASATDVLLPMLSIDGPRLGAVTIVVSAGAAWVSFFSGSSPDLASSALARHLLDRLPDGVAILRLDGTLRTANESLSRILDRSPEALRGRPVSEWLGSEASLGTRELHECWIETPSGSVPVALWGSEILDRRGAPIGRVLVVREQRSLVELRRQDVALGQMSALGELAAGIAHEVNNPVAYVIANLNQLRRHQEDLAKAVPSAVAVLRAGPLIDDCIATLGLLVDFVAEVRSFAHPGTSAPMLCRVEDVVARALRLASPKLRDRHPVTSEPGDGGELRCGAQELVHALLCVLLGVGQELEESGGILVRSRTTADGAVIEVETDRALPPDISFEGDDLLLSAGPVARRPGLLVPRHLLRRQGGRLEVEGTCGGGTCIRLVVRSRPSGAVSSVLPPPTSEAAG